jgi:asparagine synthase (glutamine-hydrolysing)
VDRTLEFFTNLYLQDDILVKSDRASMLVSLESRAVFLDNDLVEFCRRLPNRFKFRNGRGKYLLRKAVTGLVPATVLERPKKGFGVPLVTWLHGFGERMPAWSSPAVRSDGAARFWQEHRTRVRDRRLFSWTWLSLQKAAAMQPAMQRSA